MKGSALLVVLLVAVGLLGCRSSAALTRIDSNVPHARLTVWSSSDTAITYQLPAMIHKVREKDRLVIEADGYYTFEGHLSDMTLVGDDNYYVELRRSSER